MQMYAIFSIKGTKRHTKISTNYPLDSHPHPHLRHSAPKRPGNANNPLFLPPQPVTIPLCGSFSPRLRLNKNGELATLHFAIVQQKASLDSLTLWLAAENRLLFASAVRSSPRPTDFSAHGELSHFPSAVAVFRLWPSLEQCRRRIPAAAARVYASRR